MLNTTRREFIVAAAGIPAVVVSGSGFITEQKPPQLHTTKDGFDVVKSAVKSDEGYALTWHCNIAVAAIDEGVDHKTAQKIAARFMGWAFQVDTMRLHGEER